MEQINIVSKLSLNDYIKSNFRISYLKVLNIMIGILGFLFLFVGGAMALHDMVYPNPARESSSSYFVFFYGLALVLYVPVKVYFSSKNIFKSNQRIQEEMTYEFSEKEIKTTGTSFNSGFDWNKLYKIRRVKNILLLYQGKQVANFINLDSVSEVDYNRLKELILSKKLNIKVKL